MLVPAFRAEMKFPAAFEFSRRSADVTFHDSLHWLFCHQHSEDFSRKQGSPSKLPFLKSVAERGRALYSYVSREKVNGIRA